MSRQSWWLIFTVALIVSFVIAIVLANGISELLDCMAAQAGEDTIARLAACD